MILTYTIISILHFNVPATNKSNAVGYRVESVWTFVGGLSDLFITVMVWFILDDKAKIDIFTQGDRSYAVMNVVRQSRNINEDEDEEMPGRESVYSRDSTIADRMISQFF